MGHPSIRGRMQQVAKDKKKKKDKDGGKKSRGKPLASATGKAGKTGKVGKSKVTTAAKKLKAMTENPLVADIVAAALVATAAALKDSKKARALAENAGEELETLARNSADRGNALWQLALDVGRRAVAEFAADEARPPKRSRKK